MNKILILSAVLFISACAPQTYAKKFGGTVNEDLPPNMKLVNATWEGDHIWYVLRPMRPGEEAEVITIHESSKWGILQGNIVAHEKKQ